MKGTILIIDDNKPLLKSLSDLFEDRGYIVLTYDSAPEGIEAINGGLRYDLALFDLCIDETPLEDLARVSKRANPKAHIVCLTAADNIGYIAKNYAGLVKEFWEKNTAEELESHIEHYFSLIRR